MKKNFKIGMLLLSGLVLLILGTNASFPKQAFRLSSTSSTEKSEFVAKKDGGPILVYQKNSPKLNSAGNDVVNVWTILPVGTSCSEAQTCKILKGTCQDLCRTQIALRHPNDPQNNGYTVVKELRVNATLGDVLRITAQVELSEEENESNEITIHLKNGSSRISAYARQIATRDDNHHMPLSLTTDHVVGNSDPVQTIRLLAKRQSVSHVIIEKGDYARITVDVYKNGLGGHSLKSFTTTSGESTTPTSNNDLPSALAAIEVPASDSDRIIQIHSAVVDRFLDLNGTGRAALTGHTLHINGVRKAVATENISPSLYRFTHENSFSQLIPKSTKPTSVSMYAKTHYDPELNNNGYTVEDNALSVFEFSPNGTHVLGKQLVIRKSPTICDTISGIVDTNTKRICSPINEPRNNYITISTDTVAAKANDVLRVNADITVSRTENLVAQSNCSTRFLFSSVDKKGVRNRLPKVMFFQRSISSMYKYAHLAPYGAIRIPNNPNIVGVEVETILKCNSTDRNEVYEIPQGFFQQTIEVFEAI